MGLERGEGSVIESKAVRGGGTRMTRVRKGRGMGGKEPQSRWERGGWVGGESRKEGGETVGVMQGWGREEVDDGV